MGEIKVKLEKNSIFYESQEMGKQYLLALDLDRLLAPLYEGAELKSQHMCYGGWESMQIKGHSVGHYLSAVACMFSATHDLELKRRMDYLVSSIALIQRDNGYVGGFKSTPFDIAFMGEFEVEHFSLNGHWVPWYSIHKIYAGLLDAYLIGGNEQALEVVVKMADWAYEGSKQMTDEQFNKMLICEYGGMNEVMGILYEITQNDHYLRLAKRFSQPLIIDPLAAGVDELQGKHANTQIPKVLGAAKLYEITKDPYYFNAVKFFFDTVTQKRSFVIGGNSNSEHFARAKTELLTRDTAETCNTYNMMKLAQYLFKWTKQSLYMDYYERALYNHILASQDPISGGKIYFTSLYPGHFKVYGTKEESFWCCTGTGMENPARYHQHIFYKDQDDVYINLFIPSTLVLKDEKLNISIQTAFPYENKVYIKFNETPCNKINLKIRIPSWTKENYKVVYKNEVITVDECGYLTIGNHFVEHDKICLTVSLKLHEYIAMDDPHKIAFLYGPVVLAAQLGWDDFPETDIVSDHLSLMSHAKIQVKPIICNSVDLSKEFVMTDSKTLTFKRMIEDEELVLKPFYDTHHQRYSVYLKKYTSKEFEQLGDELLDRDQLLFDKTIDVVKTGEQQSEIEHHFKGMNSYAGYLSDVDMWWRDARGVEGLIAYELEVEKHVKNGLMVSYYGLNGKQYDGVDRTFDIYINHQMFKQECLIGSGEANVVDIVDEIPNELIELSSVNKKGKDSLTVNFKNSGSQTVVGGILEVRIIRL